MRRYDAELAREIAAADRRYARLLEGRENHDYRPGTGKESEEGDLEDLEDLDDRDLEEDDEDEEEGADDYDDQDDDDQDEDEGDDLGDFVSRVGELLKEVRMGRLPAAALFHRLEELYDGLPVDATATTEESRRHRRPAGLKQIFEGVARRLDRRDRRGRRFGSVGEIRDGRDFAAALRGGLR